MKNLNVIISDAYLRRRWLEEIKKYPKQWRTTLMIAPTIITNIALNNEDLETWTLEQAVARDTVTRYRKEIREAFEEANRIEALLSGFGELWRHCWIRFFHKGERDNFFGIQVDIPPTSLVRYVHIQKWDGHGWIHLTELPRGAKKISW